MPHVSPQLVPAVDRALQILDYLSRADAGVRVTDLARDLEIPKSSAFQIATTMVHHGVLECDADSRRYRLGPKLLTFAAGRQRMTDLPTLAVPHLHAVARATGLTTLLGVSNGAATVLTAKAESPEPLGVSAPVGFELERTAGAFGKVFMAALGDDARAALLRRGLPAYTSRSVTDADEMERELQRVRRNGVSTDIEEYLDGVRAVAAPITDETGDVVAAICALGVAARLKRQQLPGIIDEVRRAARKLSDEVGGTPTTGDAA